MATRLVRRYLRFLASRRSVYLKFNKQLIIGELAGLGAGIAAAQAASSAGLDQLAITAYSSIADYGCSVAGFLFVYYNDYKSNYRDETGYRKFKAVMLSALSLWPSVIAADLAFVIGRPYVHYVSMSFGLEPGLAAALAHVLAFGLFNLVAVFSRSLIDYSKHGKMSSSV